MKGIHVVKRNTGKDFLSVDTGKGDIHLIQTRFEYIQDYTRVDACGFLTYNVYVRATDQ